MRRALTLARRGRTSPNPMVGAVVVRDGEIVGEGYHPRAGDPHAEIFALEKAGDRAHGGDLYVTLEPCCHHGRTPPCTDAVAKSGIRRVFAAMTDPNPQVGGRGIGILRSAGIEVQIGLMESDARELNRAYIKRVTTGMPFVLWKAAMTLDGKIATRTGDSRWVTNERSRREVHRLRSSHDAVMVGIGTILADNPALTVRAVRGTNPVTIVVDRLARTPLDAKVLNSDTHTLITIGDRAPSEKIEALRNSGAEILALREIDGRLDMRELMAAVAEKGWNSVLLEGGGELAASMLGAGLVDRGLVFISPKIVGGRAAKTPVEGQGIELMGDALVASKPRIRRFGDDLALEVNFELGLGTDLCSRD